jgi:hypothetical protein
MNIPAVRFSYLSFSMIEKQSGNPSVSFNSKFGICQIIQYHKEEVFDNQIFCSNPFENNFKA